MHDHPGRPDHGHPEIHANYGPEAAYAVRAEAALPTTAHDREIARGLELGLPGADSIVDRSIPTFSRGELPHFAASTPSSRPRTWRTCAAAPSTTSR